MNVCKHRRVIALFLTLALCLGMLPTAFAAQGLSYYNPAERWVTSSNRTNELDANAIVSRETFHCCDCNKDTIFAVYRTPEYSRDGASALSRNVMYSDGTTVDEQGRGYILDGTPGVDAYYTGYHWTKAVCETCGTINSNMGMTAYCYNKSIYRLNDCATEFFQDIPESVSYEYADSRYHTKTTKSGDYCIFCFGTHKASTSKLERHDLTTTIQTQLANQRFVEVETCADCGYTHTGYLAAKSVITSYYGVSDGRPHTVTVSDLSDAGVSTAIRYGNTANGCTLTSAPNYTEPGEYTVYYKIAYSYNGETMEENGVAYIRLRDETVKEDGSCGCGCGHMDCGCHDSHCGGNCCNKPCGGHRYTLLDSTEPTCYTLGYDRYLCTECGQIEKRDYEPALGHAWQSVVIREATCDVDGKVMELCARCGEVNVKNTPKGEHEYTTYPVAATCTSSGYTVRECSMCGQRQIEDITSTLAHVYKATVTPATCEAGGHTTHRCEGCGSSFITDYTEPLGHAWGDGTPVTGSTCNGEGVTEYRCARCNARRLEAVNAEGHVPGAAATCTQPQLCRECGAVLTPALGHNYKSTVTPPTCTEMGYTTYACTRCGNGYKTDYTNPARHNYESVITEPTCTEQGYTTYTCSRCGKSFVSDYTEPLGHSWGTGRPVTVSTCDGAGVKEYRCERCDYHRLEAISPEGHTPGEPAACGKPQLCVKCGAVLAEALSHSYKATVTAPTCEKMGFTTYTCAACGDSYKGDYTDATGHKAGDWIVDKAATTYAQGQKHKECTVCKKVLETAVIEKLYMTATTDTHGEAVVDGYLVTVTDTDTRQPVSGAEIALDKKDGLTVLLPARRLLAYNDQTTITVRLVKDGSGVSALAVAVTDKNDNYAAAITDRAGKVTVPQGSTVTNGDGKATVGWTDADRDKHTLTVKVTDFETTRPIVGADVSIGKTGNITVTLPRKVDMDKSNRITVTVTDHKQSPQEGLTVIVKADLGQREEGLTDKDGVLTVPALPLEPQEHGAYIVGYDNGNFGPEDNMTRGEAAAIFARLLAQRKGEHIYPTTYAAYSDIPAGAWYGPYARYLTSYGVTYGRGNGTFAGDELISRAEFVTMAVRFFSVYGDGDPDLMEQYKSFDDVAEGYWAARYIQKAAAYGWINGYSDGLFHGGANITRAEAVTVVNRLLGREADKDYIKANLRKLVTFPDVPAQHWAYYAVMEAANGHMTAPSKAGESWNKK